MNESAHDTSASAIAAEATQEATSAQSLYERPAGGDSLAAQPVAAGQFKEAFAVIYTVPDRRFDVCRVDQLLRSHLDCYIRGKVSDDVIIAVHNNRWSAMEHMAKLEFPNVF